MRRITREDIQRALNYPRPGDRVRAVFCSDQYTNLVPGTLGTVVSVDDALTVHVNWDTGLTLGLIPGEDRWELLPRPQKLEVTLQPQKPQEA